MEVSKPPQNLTGHTISATGAAIAALCFFLPWIMVSCGGMSVNISGLELATGKTINNGFYNQPTNGDPVFFLILLAAVGSLILAVKGLAAGRLSDLDGWGMVGCGVLALVVLWIKFNGLQGETSLYGISVYTYEIGLWGTIVGNLIVIVGGLINLSHLPRASSYGPSPQV